METNATLEMKDDLRQFPLAFNALLMREVQAQNAIRQKCLEDIARAQSTVMCCCCVFILSFIVCTL